MLIRRCWLSRRTEGMRWPGTSVPAAIMDEISSATASYSNSDLTRSMRQSSPANSPPNSNSCSAKQRVQIMTSGTVTCTARISCCYQRRNAAHSIFCVGPDTSVKCLRRGESAVVAHGFPLTVLCCAGCIAIDRQDGSHRLYLAAGECFSSDHHQSISVAFSEGPRDEWLTEIGLAVFAVSSRM